MCTDQRKSIQARTQGQATVSPASTPLATGLVEMEVRSASTVEAGMSTKELISTARTGAVGVVDTLSQRSSVVEVERFTQELTSCAPGHKRENSESDGEAM